VGAEPARIRMYRELDPASTQQVEAGAPSAMTRVSSGLMCPPPSTGLADPVSRAHTRATAPSTRSSRQT